MQHLSETQDVTAFCEALQLGDQFTIEQGVPIYPVVDVLYRRRLHPWAARQEVSGRRIYEVAHVVRLQGVGEHFAVRADQLRPGMVMVWNSGATSILKSIEPTSPKTLNAVEVTEDGREWNRRLRMERLVAVKHKSYYAHKDKPTSGGREA